jgi:hypothetical protein
MFNAASVSSPDGGRGRFGNDRHGEARRLPLFGARLPRRLDELTDPLAA